MARRPHSLPTESIGQGRSRSSEPNDRQPKEVKGDSYTSKRPAMNQQDLDIPDYDSDYHQLSFTQHQPAIVDNDCEPSDSEYATSQEDLESDEETLPMDKYCFAASTKGKATNSNTAVSRSFKVI